ncbi:MAG TPA: triose-phosphate isomerase [Terriglobia bacterium]|nr:triose-phosphate isomerase [Terriglobia bacterium]
MRRPVIAGNWKMHKTIPEAVELIESLKPRVADVHHCEIVVAPPFTSLSAASKAAGGSNIHVAGQDMGWEKEGAFTGDISGPMLRDVGCTHVIIGHSERRLYHHETDENVNRKAQAALATGLTPIICVGETLAEREAKRTQEVLERQFLGAFAGWTEQDFSRVIIAYEPVWAIGTGRTATPDVAAASHRILRRLAGGQFGEEASEKVQILYGGSVNPGNIKQLMAEDAIDGALVGGASLKADSFSAIVRYQP